MVRANAIYYQIATAAQHFKAQVKTKRSAAPVFCRSLSTELRGRRRGRGGVRESRAPYELDRVSLLVRFELPPPSALPYNDAAADERNNGRESFRLTGAYLTVPCAEFISR
jgi:hypothetical protein